MKHALTPDIRAHQPLPWGKIWLVTAMTVVGLGILIFTYLNFTPVFRVTAPTGDSDPKKVQIPDYDLTAWHALPVQDQGRYKPFETACREMMRRIVGREKLAGRDAVAVVLMWMFEVDPNNRKAVSQWDDKDFILCGHEELRRLIYELDKNGNVQHQNLKSEELHGHFMSPKVLRQFRESLAKLRKDNLEKYKDLIKPVERQLSEVEERLSLYESIRGIEPQKEYNRPADAKMKDVPDKPSDPFAFVALDKVPGSPWFSIGDLRLLNLNQEAWVKLYMTERVGKAPQLYISEKHAKALEDFQAQVKAGNAEQALSELQGFQVEARKKTIAKFKELRADNKRAEADQLVERSLLSLPTVMVDGKGTVPEEIRRVAMMVIQAQEAEKKDNVDKTSEISSSLNRVLEMRDARVVEDIRTQLPTKKQGYDPADPRFRMLHLTYMEARYPDIYKEAAQWQKVPTAKIEKVLASYAKLGAAYRSGNADRFAAASEDFFTTVENESTPPYPGDDTVSTRLGILIRGDSLNPPSRQLLSLEQTFNRIAPFQKAWVLMLLSMLFFCLSLGLDSKKCYVAGWTLFLGSLGFQLFGYFVRVIISGRPPVTNMYETVIWVSFMVAIFGGVLEWIYRKKVIALAAAFVATLGLVLADQLPLALDPKINPLVPVLRSNFWLTIHVLVIVASYAGGSLAWGLGNVALFLILFGKSDKSDTIKLLSNFTYRAMQIAVLLLAAGTFLGGWWAAYSWGRFWGWDPKETGALIALVCYVIPLHMRFIGWIKDFGLAVASILCYAAILMSWYGVNFVFPAGLHSYGFGGGGAGWVYWASLINIEWVLVASWIYLYRRPAPELAPAAAAAASAPAVPQEAIMAGAGAGGEKVSEHVKA